MDIEEAKQALNEGKRIKHRSFTSKEWVEQYSSCRYVFEDGVKQNSDEFWNMRTQESWKNGWREC